MAVNSISSVNFCAANNVNTASSMLERPGKFAKPATPTAAPENILTNQLQNYSAKREQKPLQMQQQTQVNLLQMLKYMHK